MSRRRKKKLDKWKIIRWTAITVLVAFLIIRLTRHTIVPKLIPVPIEAVEADHSLPQVVQDRLSSVDWNEHVGERMALWVSTYWQRIIVIQGGVVQSIYPCSTAARGTGNKEGSYQTPLGWHEVIERIGDGLPQGAVFSERKYTGKVWTADQATEKDYVLTRILWLRGLEPGLNAGGSVDSHERYIYIHGTPAEGKIGTPASLGCIRMLNRDVIDLFARTPSGTPVLITEW